MRKLIDIVGTLPIVLIAIYILLFFITDNEVYYNLYTPVVEPIDNFLVLSSLTGFLLGGYRIWGPMKIKSFVTVIILNILTEISYTLEVQNYYQIYAILLCIFISTITLTQFFKAET